MAVDQLKATSASWGGMAPLASPLYPPLH